ncbi:hypothetical protein CLV30_11126 [Haloactinopolyspora alba]|uniref:Polynucleotide kinase PNKP phosphatase domain-containing protein n=1 Tax=Haloactinopolyspora alba TaxID=648780 RepID=A0A2P8DXX9_9ACTN|nr:hypothetical protein [Haloactinopolyspora alba]PSL02071.1 hypothetical protein CLV30_11126 [Haloactinopolyspora alba]
MTPPLAVIDIDGVLADVEHRIHHLRGRPKNWAGFFASMGSDPPYTEGLDMAAQLAADHTIVYLSGRPERTRAVTQSWLATHKAPTGRVMLRPDDDRRPARLFKIGVLKRLAAQRSVALLVDDDPAVCTAAREAGFEVRQVDWGSRTPVLYAAQERHGRT